MLNAIGHSCVHQSPVISDDFAQLSLVGAECTDCSGAKQAIRTYLPVKIVRLHWISKYSRSADHPLMHESARPLSTASNGRLAATARGDSSILSCKTTPESFSVSISGVFRGRANKDGRKLVVASLSMCLVAITGTIRYLSSNWSGTHRSTLKTLGENISKFLKDHDPQPPTLDHVHVAEEIHAFCLA